MIESSAPYLWQMWAILAAVGVAIIFYIWERYPIEVVSAAVVAVGLLFFQVFPLPEGNPGARDILAGFANPALMTIMALLVVGQGIFQTGAMEGPTQRLLESYESHPMTTLLSIFGFVFVVSAFINNTPVVVMFIPILVAIAGRMGSSPSKIMIPLSYVCILAGMTTLIGSSTNLLVSDSLRTLTGDGLEFFSPTGPGLILAGVGVVYSAFVLPRLLPDRATMESEIAGGDGKQFIAQIEVTRDHPLVGKSPVAGMFADLPNMTVRMIQRGEHAYLPPFDEIELRAGDLVIVAATRKTLSDLLSTRAEFLRGLLQTAGPGEDPTPGERLALSEAVVPPGSRITGRTVEQAGFRNLTDTVVLGVQRRSRMIRKKMGEIRLEAGDVLLLFGTADAMRRLRNDRDLLLMAWATTDLRDPRRATASLVIFGGVIVLAATNLLPIVHASIFGAVAMIATGCLNARQAARAIDMRVYLLVGSAFALGTALQSTGAADFLASLVVGIFAPFGPVALLSALFILVALLTNVLSNNATAILFTPIAVGAANQFGADPMLFALTVLFAANTSFATPIGYQTNLLVMGPGHYKFADYIRAGAPLVVIMWIVFTVYAAVRFGI
ncbi:SLC13 family permease [Hyphobacterium marinum]|uniref:SLC13 family permease n=1 Tax=Hyphobacterium marinum TaxID=3116574 RepID=A0ABU7LZU2_9PROT|nr:SLC13 family permease [Hyphobacterium sp. Y6023]MEE2566695.1 SLC13 family permease [Hyphobacterium sp. Y6023]